MEAYSGFAGVYDLFMDNVPYERYQDYVIKLLKQQGISRGLLLELGCGTGNLTMGLAKQGFDLIGVDSSAEMLQIAMEKSRPQYPEILYLHQDMREFELYGTVRAVISVCDSINYLLTEEELVQTFKLVNNYLDPGGVFIFDLNTEYKYERIGDHTIAEDREEGSFIWENFYDAKRQINQYDLTLFLPAEKESGLYRKLQETHQQRAYSLAAVKAALQESGLLFVAAYDEFSFLPVRADSERMFVVAREQNKQ